MFNLILPGMCYIQLEKGFQKNQWLCLVSLKRDNINNLYSCLK